MLGIFRLRTSASRRLFSFTTAFVFLFTAVLVHAKDYTRIVVFGDSLSDTGNMAHLYAEQPAGLRFPAPWADYTDGRFTDGVDTIPSARNYFGVWIEQFAASMPSRPEVVSSLDGGTNYAYGFALTGDGTGLFYPDDDVTFSVTVNNMGQQITDYLATNPKINNSTLFVIWGGANDLLHGGASGILTAAENEVADIQRLIEAGATQFLVLNLPPLGLTPRINPYPDSARDATLASAYFNYFLAGGLAAVKDYYPNRHVVLFQLDVFSLFNQIAAAPADYGLADISDFYRTRYLANPDTYLFWDDIHPTTRGHSIVAEAAIKLLASPQCDALGMPSCAAVH
jgi:phospholipase/lecithinase/hemolysin